MLIQDAFIKIIHTQREKLNTQITHVQCFLKKSAQTKNSDWINSLLFCQLDLKIS